MSFFPADPAASRNSLVFYVADAHDPRVVPTYGTRGTLYIRVGNLGGDIFTKLDNGTTTNWQLNSAISPPAIEIDKDSVPVVTGVAKIDFVNSMFEVTQPVAGTAQIKVKGTPNNVAFFAPVTGELTEDSDFYFISSQNFLQIGTLNVGTGTEIICLGFNHIVNGIQSICSGNGNTLSVGSQNAMAVGSGNTISSVNGIALGEGNNISGSSSGGFGYFNTVSHAKSFALGSGLTSSRTEQVLAGRNNQTDAQAQFQVGIGINPGTPKTGFSVGDDGLIKMQEGGVRYNSKWVLGGGYNIDPRLDNMMIFGSPGMIITLPPGVNGMSFLLKDGTGIVNPNHTINPSGPDLIEGAPSLGMNSPYRGYRLTFNNGSGVGTWYLESIT